MKPKLSVVIASHNARYSASECLSELESQRKGREFEIIVVDNSTDGTDAIITSRFPGVKFIKSLESNFIPELWEIGVSQSSGEIIAITTSHFVPQKDWTDEILKAHGSKFAGIGGAVENDERAGLIDWAIYFCRYSAYMLPFSKTTVKDFAGDNASYKRLALECCKDARNNGFWEPEIHAELIKNGLELLITPTIVVYHKKSFNMLGFMKQRFWHGRQFGKDRVLHISDIRRMLYILLSPLIPVVFLSRITRQVLAKRKHRGKFFLSLPILISFLLSWSAGELSGYLFISKNRK